MMHLKVPWTTEFFCSSINVDFILLLLGFMQKKKNEIKNEWLKIRLSKYRHNSHLWLNYPIELTVYEFMSEVDCYRRLKKKSLFTNFIPFSAANVRKQCLIGPFT